MIEWYVGRPVCAHQWWDFYCLWLQQAYVGRLHSRTNQHNFISLEFDLKLAKWKTWRSGLANGTKRAPSCFTVPLKVRHFWEKCIIQIWHVFKMATNKLFCLLNLSNVLLDRQEHSEVRMICLCLTVTWWKALCWIFPPSWLQVEALARKALWRSHQQRDLYQDDDNENDDNNDVDDDDDDDDDDNDDDEDYPMPHHHLLLDQGC